MMTELHGGINFRRIHLRQAVMNKINILKTGLSGAVTQLLHQLEVIQLTFLAQNVRAP